MGGGEAGRARLVKCVQYRVATMLLMQIQLLRKSKDGAGVGGSGGPGRVDDVMLETARLSRLLGGLTALDTTHRVIYMRVAVHHNLEVRAAIPPSWTVLAFSPSHNGACGTKLKYKLTAPAGLIPPPESGGKFGDPICALTLTFDPPNIQLSPRLHLHGNGCARTSHGGVAHACTRQVTSWPVRSCLPVPGNTMRSKL